MGRGRGAPCAGGRRLLLAQSVATRACLRVGNSMGVCPVACACVCGCVGGSVRARGQVRVSACALLVFVCVDLCLP